MNQDAKGNPTLEELEALLVSCDAPKEEVVRSLRRQGLDTDAFFSRIKQVVQTGYADLLRRAAEQERAESASIPDFLAQLKAMSREAMLELFRRLSAGEFGTVYRDAALARCRNKGADELSNDELRSWLEDVGEALGEPKQ
jgi:hypothetical protein